MNRKDTESNRRIDEKKEVKFLKSLSNCDVMGLMGHLASYLNNQDLGSFYDTCQNVKEALTG